MSPDNNNFRIAKFISYPSLISPEIKDAPQSMIELQKYPKDIKDYLDKFIIGQHEAKKVLAIAAYNRTMRLWSQHLEGTPCVEKSNVLLLGPTGCGKTLLIKTLAHIIGAPCIMEDATTLTESGYIGRDVVDMFEHLLTVVKHENPQIHGETSSDWSLRIQKIAESGIIYIDEIDKIAQIKGTGHGVSGLSVQEELLKIIEGTEVQLRGNRDSRGGKASSSEVLSIDTINTTNILFIVGGSFHGLEEIIKKRIANSTIGFCGNVFSKEIDKNILCLANNEDLIKFGLLPELLGRFHSHVGLTPLEEADLINILTQTEGNLIQQYTKLFSYYQRDLVFADTALSKIANVAMKSKTGARGLKRIMERSLRDLMFNSPSTDEAPPILIEESDIKE